MHRVPERRKFSLNRSQESKEKKLQKNWITLKKIKKKTEVKQRRCSCKRNIEPEWLFSGNTNDHELEKFVSGT